MNNELMTRKASVKDDQPASQKSRQEPSSTELSIEALDEVIGGLLPAVQKNSATGGAGAG